MNLTEIKTGSTVTITAVRGHHHIHERLSEMGFVPGREVTLLYKAPTGTPLVFGVMGTQVALRRDEAVNVHTGTERQPDTHVLSASDLMSSVRASVQRIDHLHHFGERDSHSHGGAQCASCPSCPSCSKKAGSHVVKSQDDARREICIALIGNPNCGKTSLFNALSGGHEHTGNYSGVTVHSVEGETTYRGVKLRVIDLPGTYSLHAFSPEEAYVAHELQKGHIDVILNVLDANALERNLLLTLQTKVMDIPMIGALNIYDEFRSSGSTLDVEELSRRLGMPLVPTVARTREGVSALLDEIIAIGNTKANTPDETVAEPSAQPTYPAIAALLDGIYHKHESPAERRTAIIDRLAAGSWVAYPIFFALLWLMFWLTFTIGQYPMDWIDAAVSWLADMINSCLPDGQLSIINYQLSIDWLRSLLVDGVLGGVGSVIVFLPNILILYCLMTMLEDSGYLARAALLADPSLSRFGLHGKSFIPMLMGFGCNVPAVMATRTIETGKSRLLTLFVIPLMSCSARIPIYTAFAGAFFMRHASLVMLALYALGIVAAIVVAAVLNRCIMRGHGSHFVMELPPYRLPEWSSVWTHTWEKGRQYLRKMGGIILIASVVIWALNYITIPGAVRSSELSEYSELSEFSENPEVSLMEHIGHAIEPAIRPLGFDWRMGVGIVAGVSAKELMVSTLGVLYSDTPSMSDAPSASDDPSVSDGSVVEADDSTRLQAAIAAHTTPASALAYMVFALLYFPCIATIVAIKNETGHWHHALFVAVYTTALAWLAAFATYHLFG